MLADQYNLCRDNFDLRSIQYEEIIVYFGSTLDTIYRLAIFGFNNQIEGVLSNETVDNTFPRLYVSPIDADQYAQDCSTRCYRYILVAKFLKLENDTNDNERGYFLCKVETNCLPIYLIKYNYENNNGEQIEIEN
jgi:hypothetical protein